jgi:hypothetical protein
MIDSLQQRVAGEHLYLTRLDMCGTYVEIILIMSIGSLIGRIF